MNYLDLDWMNAVNDQMCRTYHPKDWSRPTPAEKYVDMPFIDSSLLESLMSTPSTSPPPGDQDVFRNGAFLLRFNGPRPWIIEAWCKVLRERSGVSAIDWQYERVAVLYVKTTPELGPKVLDAIRETWPTFCAAAAKLADVKKDDGNRIFLM